MICHFPYNYNTSLLSLSDEDFHSFITDLMYYNSLDLNQTLCVNITIIDDEILENDEDFSVFLVSTDNSVTTGSPSTVSITDNDGMYILITVSLQV